MKSGEQGTNSRRLIGDKKKCRKRFCPESAAGQNEATRLFSLRAKLTTSLPLGKLRLSILRTNARRPVLCGGRARPADKLASRVGRGSKSPGLAGGSNDQSHNGGERMQPQGDFQGQARAKAHPAQRTGCPGRCCKTSRTETFEILFDLAFRGQWVHSGGDRQLGHRPRCVRFDLI